MEIKKKYVWRMQDKNGEGPYNPNTRLMPIWKTIQGPYNPSTHPGPSLDGLGVYFLYPERSWKFGFPSKKKADEWFDMEDQRQLKKQGYQIKRLAVTDLVVSNSGRQCIFRS